MCNAWSRAHSDVFLDELLCSEIREDFSVVDAIVDTVFLFALLESVKFMSDGTVHGVKHGDQVNWLLLEWTILRQCSQFHEAAFRPVRDLVVYNVHFLETFLELLIVALHQCQILVHFNDLGVVCVKLASFFSVVFALDLQVLHHCCELLVLLFESVDTGLAWRYCCEQCCVIFFFLLEAADHGLHISDSCMCLDLLESFINASGSLHLFVHFSLHEIIPELINVKVVTHLEFGAILALIGSCFCDFLIFLLSFDAAFDRLFFVSNATLKF